jgi:hypothetical protein
MIVFGKNVTVLEELRSIIFFKYALKATRMDLSVVTLFFSLKTCKIRKKNLLFWPKKELFDTTC